MVAGEESISNAELVSILHKLPLTLHACISSLPATQISRPSFLDKPTCEEYRCLESTLHEKVSHPIAMCQARCIITHIFRLPYHTFQHHG